VLLFTLLTGGIFAWVWIFRQAGWVQRIDPSSRAHLVLAIGLVGAVVLSVLLLVFAPADVTSVAMRLVRFGFGVAWVWAYLSMRQSIEARFDISLSGILTFFFTVFYLQYHMTRIAKGQHAPERRGVFA
jgi:hypothetical protein